MVLYRTDDYNHEKMSTNLVDVITYEFFDRENDDALKGLIKFLDLTGGENDILKDAIKYRNRNDKAKVVNLIKDVISYIFEKTGHDLVIGLWLYPLKNVQDYYSFEGFDPVIFGYEVSQFPILSYEGEGTLFAYEKMPDVCDKE